jgi:tetratricopeptide (TPR) repeat protein
VADPGAEARIRDLKRRLELDPGSRLFVALAEELRKSGRIADALSTLQQGLLAHPHYVSAHVALGRAYLEAGQITEAIATFSKILLADPGNLVAAKSLADIYLSRGESLEAVKKYKLYRALSGDRKVEEVIQRLEAELAPPPPATPQAAAAPPPPPPSFIELPAGQFRRSRLAPIAGQERSEVTDPFDIGALDFEPADASYPPVEAEPFPVLSRDMPLAVFPHKRPEPPLAEEPATPPPPSPPPARMEPEEAESPVTMRINVAEHLAAPPPPPPPEPVEPEPPAGPQGRTLADLYFAQGHYAEALRIYDELVAADPYDAELKRLRRDAEARLLPASSTPGGAAPDAALQRRLGKIRALKQWLSVVQAR